MSRLPRCSLLALVLCAPSLVLAREVTELPGGSMTLADGLVTTTWECADTVLDGRNKKGIGVATCVRGLLLDPSTGRSALVVELRADAKDPINLNDLQLRAQLDSGRTERLLELSAPVALHRGWSDAPVAPELPAVASLLDPSPALSGPSEAVAHHGTFVFEFQTWDPSVPLTFIQLQVVGSGKSRWKFDPTLAWDGDWEARPETVWEDGALGPSCSLHSIKGNKAGAAADALSDGASSLPLQARWDVLSKDEDGLWEVGFPDHAFYVRYDGGKLKVRGQETFILPLIHWKTDGSPNPIELVYDGTFVTLRIGDETFGPMAGRRRSKGDRFRWALEFEGSNHELRDLEVASCTLEEPQKWAAPVVRERPAALSAGGGAVASTPGVSGGRVVLAVLSRNGQSDKPVKRKKSAREIMAGAATALQGAAAVGQGLAQFGDDVNQNLSAMESGDVSKMKSSSTRIDVGPGGVTSSRSEATLGADGRSVNMTSETRSYQSPSARLEQADALSGGRLTGAGHAPGTVTTATIIANSDAQLAIGGEELGPLRRGDVWVVQLAPGLHTVQVEGEASAAGELSAGAGRSITPTVGRGLVADPPAVWAPAR